MSQSKHTFLLTDFRRYVTDFLLTFYGLFSPLERQMETRYLYFGIEIRHGAQEEILKRNREF